MRTNIVIDDDLMDRAMAATGFRTKRETVEEGLRTLARLRDQRSLSDLRGTVEWIGDLDEMRRD